MVIGDHVQTLPPFRKISPNEWRQISSKLRCHWDKHSSVVVIVIIVGHEELIFLEKGRHLFADPSTNADPREDSGEELEEAEPRRRLRLLYQRPRIERGAGPRSLFLQRRHAEGRRRRRCQGHRRSGGRRGRHEKSPAHLLELEAPRTHG